MMKQLRSVLYAVIFLVSLSLIIYQTASTPNEDVTHSAQKIGENLEPRPRMLMPDLPLGPHIPSDSLLGIIDTGVDQEHPQLQGTIVHYRDFTGEGLKDEHGHGTLMVLKALSSSYRKNALLSGGSKTTDNDSRTIKNRPTGIAMAKVIGLKPVSDETMRSRIDAAIKWLLSLNVKVISLSLR